MTGHWAAKIATYLYDTGVTSGTGQRVSPSPLPLNRNITRGEFFALVARWLDLDLDECADCRSCPLADAVRAPAWVLGEIKAMYSLGILGEVELGEALLERQYQHQPGGGHDHSGHQAKGYEAPRPHPQPTREMCPPGPWTMSRILVGQGRRGVQDAENELARPSPSPAAKMATMLYTMR